MKNKTVLVIAPHMDDETLAMGGTIAKHIRAGDRVLVCFVAHRIYGGKFDEKANQREMNCSLLAKDILGYEEAEFLNLNDERLDVAVQDIIKPLEKYINQAAPDVVYSNFFGDNNQDHRAVFQAVRVVLRPYAKTRVLEWYLYETPSSTDQSPPVPESAFMPNYYVEVDKTFKMKIKALKAYETELRNSPHPRSEEYLTALAVKRGGEVGFKKAEAFMIMRRCWK